MTHMTSVYFLSGCERETAGLPGTEGPRTLLGPVTPEALVIVAPASRRRQRAAWALHGPGSLELALPPTILAWQ